MKKYLSAVFLSVLVLGGILVNTSKVFARSFDATLTINKVCNPAGDTGKFNLQIDGLNKTTDSICGGTTGPIGINEGSYTVGEVAGSGTDLSQYTSVISGDCALDGTITLAVDDIKTCTITNTKKGFITVYKHVVGGSKTASDFTIRVDVPVLAVRNSIFDKIFTLFKTTKAYAMRTFFIPSIFHGNEEGTAVQVEAATRYIVSEDFSSDYSMSLSEDCSGYISPTEQKVCIITNTSITPPPQGSGPLIVQEPIQPPTPPVVENGNSNGNETLPPSPLTPPLPPSTGEVLGAETFQFTRTLRRGMKGNDVLELHKKLTELGFYKGVVDDIFGKELEKAVKAFQKANPPLKVDGIVGPLTRAVLNK